MAKKPLQINYFLDMRPYNLGKSLHCQICNEMILPVSWSGGKLTKCKCTKKELSKRKRYK